MMIRKYNGAVWLHIIDGVDVYICPEKLNISDDIIEDIVNHAIRLFKRVEENLYYPPNNEHIISIHNYAFAIIMEYNYIDVNDLGIMGDFPIKIDNATLEMIVSDCRTPLEGEDTK